MSVKLYPGDNRQWLAALKAHGVQFHSVVTDPPYGIKFMGRKWDGGGIENDPTFWRAVLDVMLPGAYCFAFSSTRTVHRQMVAMEDAGFVLHPLHIWMFGTGFPKAHAADKAIDKRGGNNHLVEQIAAAIKAAREKRGVSKKECDDIFCGGSTNYSWFEGRPQGINIPDDPTFAKLCAAWPELSQWAEKVKTANREVIGERTVGIGTGKGATAYIGDSENRDITAAATPEAKRWEGWAYGTQAQKPALEPIVLAQKPFSERTGAANLLRHGVGAVNIDGCRVPASDGYTQNCVIQGMNASQTSYEHRKESSVFKPNAEGRHPANLIHDGSDAVTALFPNDAERFFHTFPHDEQGAYYYPKASKADRAGSKHPTAKPVALMQHLIRHITPPGGTVLDPFAGSGTTAEAAKRERFDCVLMEQEPEYIAFLADRFRDDA